MKRYLLLLLICTFLLAACASGSPTPTPTPTLDVRFEGVLMCDECVGGIDIWVTPSRALLLGTYPSGTPCKVLNTTPFEGQLFYKIEIEGEIGWVEVDYVQEAPATPVP